MNKWNNVSSLACCQNTQAMLPAASFPAGVTAFTVQGEKQYQLVGAELEDAFLASLWGQVKCPHKAV